MNKYFYRQKHFQNWCNCTGKRIVCVNIFIFLAPKALFFPHPYTLQITKIEVRHTLYSAQGIELSCKAPGKFEWLVLELPAANHRVSNSVFSVSSYILVRYYSIELCLTNSFLCPMLVPQKMSRESIANFACEHTLISNGSVVREVLDRSSDH